MATDTRYAQMRGTCLDVLANLKLSRTCGTDEFTDAVSRCTRSKVRLVPLQLPQACTALWLGDTGADRIGYNQEWPAHVISLAAHAVGHLALGHCDQVRDGGQFACTVDKLGPDDRCLLGRHLHDPAISRLFSDGEECEAAMFAHALADWLGLQPVPPYTDDAVRTCVG